MVQLVLDWASLEFKATSQKGGLTPIPKALTPKTLKGQFARKWKPQTLDSRIAAAKQFYQTLDPAGVPRSQETPPS